MPLFFFETFDGDTGHADKDGMDLPSEEARREVLKAMPDMAREAIPDGDFRIFRSIVRDEHGEVVYEATTALTGRWKKATTSRQAPRLVVVEVP